MLVRLRRPGALARPHDRRRHAAVGHEFDRLEGRSLLSFGTGGIVTTSISGWDAALAVAIQPADQKIVTAGYTLAPNGAVNAFAVARYTTTGTLDTSFNGTGIASTTFTTASKDYGDQADAIAIQSNGSILAGGSR